MMFALAATCSFAACNSKKNGAQNVDSSSNALKKSPKDTTQMSSGMSTSGKGSGAPTDTATATRTPKP